MIGHHSDPIVPARLHLAIGFEQRVQNAGHFEQVYVRGSVYRDQHDSFSADCRMKQAARIRFAVRCTMTTCSGGDPAFARSAAHDVSLKNIRLWKQGVPSSFRCTGTAAKSEVAVVASAAHADSKKSSGTMEPALYEAVEALGGAKVLATARHIPERRSLGRTSAPVEGPHG
jgi:hypothetical protein